MRRAFSMVELVFVIVIIGILAGIAIQKMSVTRDDATITKARSQVASIRSAITNEVQRRMMEGNYTPIQDIGGVINGYNKPIFDHFDSISSNPMVLEYPPYSCKNDKARGCWIRIDNNKYKYIAPAGVGGSVEFVIQNNRFDCVDSDNSLCRMLDR